MEAYLHILQDHQEASGCPVHSIYTYITDFDVGSEYLASLLFLSENIIHSILCNRAVIELRAFTRM